MNLHPAPFSLNAEQSRAVERFRDYHRACKAQADSKLENERAFEWRRELETTNRSNSSAAFHRQDIYPDESYESLSEELKQNKRIALAIPHWNRTPYKFTAILLADDDDIGEALSQKNIR